MLQIRIQATPNPNARKYVLNYDIKAEGKVTYQSVEECAHVPMAESLLSINGVISAHFFENVVTVTQDGSMEWASLDAAVQEVISQTYSEHDPYFIDKNKKDKEAYLSQLDPELAKIEQILDETIRPGLQMDGGDIELLELDKSVLSVRYMGACGSCPSSQAGTLAAISGILQERYSPDIEVVVVP